LLKIAATDRPKTLFCHFSPAKCGEGIQKKYKEENMENKKPLPSQGLESLVDIEAKCKKQDIPLKKYALTPPAFGI